MDQEEKEILQKTFELSEENNKILRGLRSINRWSYAMKIIYWTFIIVVAFSAYFFVQPYVEILDNTYNNIRNNVNTINSVAKKLPMSFQ
ncbi:MAG: hypothetical protein WC827_01645 [Candidatus Paceibacterota bacterium]|jgi:hypothetical protein